jgi:hypothetical protein
MKPGGKILLISRLSVRSRQGSPNIKGIGINCLSPFFYPIPQKTWKPECFHPDWTNNMDITRCCQASDKKVLLSWIYLWQH